MDDDGDYPLYDDNNSADDDFGEVYGYDDEIYGGEDDEIYGGEDDDGHDSDPAEEDQEVVVVVEEEFGDDQMQDFEEDEEEYPVYDDQLEEEIVEEQDGGEIEGEAGEHELMEEEGELLVEEDEVLYGDGAGYWDGDEPLYAPYEDDADYEDDPFDVPWLDGGEEPCPSILPRFVHFELESSDFGGDGRGIDGSESNSSTEWFTRDGKVMCRRTKRGGSNELIRDGFHGPICPICYERWTEEGDHCVCCLPCGHIYGMYCIQTWLERPNSQKCPQCNEACELGDVKRLYGMQLTTPNVEELQQKVECLEAKCAHLEIKDADWLRKEAEWKKREADLQHQLKQHKQAESGLVKDTTIQGGRDLADGSEPTNAFKDR